MKWGAIGVIAATVLLVWLFLKRSSQKEMIDLLSVTRHRAQSAENPFYPEGKIHRLDSLIAKKGSEEETLMLNYRKTLALLQLGEEEQAIEILEDFIPKTEKDKPATARIAGTYLALAYMRLGERMNCITGHVAESCIMPIQGRGVHADRSATTKAKDLFLHLLENKPDDLESRWLLNIVYMTLGEYPAGVPARWLIPGLDADTTAGIKAFRDIGPQLGLSVKNMAGGTIVDDFDNDGLLDIVSSGWGLEEPLHFFRNNGDGTFLDRSIASGLNAITGGLNIMQADYDNDGFSDIFVLRGAWKNRFGTEPNSLLHNNGDGTFSDVTLTSGLLSFHPTQTATWNDFNNDGWLDLFIGNETTAGNRSKTHPCELYVNNRNGTFSEMAAKAKCDVTAFVKGVTSGDYDNDGWQDIFISTLDGRKFLLRNTGNKNNITFEDTTVKAGLEGVTGKTFPTWFWDYNNDGWLDIFVCGYDYDRSLSYYEAAEHLGIPVEHAEKMILLENNRNGSFKDVSGPTKLNKLVFGMGSNFGDIDNDGFLDMYLGTGNPNLTSVIPNKMFRNNRGRDFVDVTTSARVGHLQKGHAVSFADLDNDGDQDIYTDMGGAYIGDAYPSAFFLNPGQSANNWICLSLEGWPSNRSAIGARIMVTFHERDSVRSVYRDVNSGGSFGSSPLRQSIGIGRATKIDLIQIRWPGSGATQVLHDVVPNQFLRIKESGEMKKQELKTISWSPSTP